MLALRKWDENDYTLKNTWQELTSLLSRLPFSRRALPIIQNMPRRLNCAIIATMESSPQRGWEGAALAFPWLPWFINLSDAAGANTRSQLSWIIVALEEQERCPRAMWHKWFIASVCFFFFMQNIIVILSYNECRNTKQRGECNKNQHNAKDQTEANWNKSVNSCCLQTCNQQQLLEVHSKFHNGAAQTI